MSISNPVSVFVTGNHTEEFVYEGGTTLYHFCPEDNGLSRSMECNVVFFANDEAHAYDVLRRMFEHIIRCSVAYQAHKFGQHDPHDFVGGAAGKVKKYQEWLAALDAGKIKLELAPTNQFFKVGWAHNDTV